MSWSAFVTAVVGGLVVLAGSVVLERYRASTAAIYGLAQARWELRRDTYLKLLALLGRALTLIHRLGERYLEEGVSTNEGVKAQAAAARNKWMKRLVSTLEELDGQGAIGLMWIKEESLKPLEKALGQFAAKKPEMDSQYWQSLSDALVQARLGIVDLAREDLKLNLPEPSEGSGARRWLPWSKRP